MATVFSCRAMIRFLEVAAMDRALLVYLAIDFVICATLALFLP